jgi:hypothetical protein
VATSPLYKRLALLGAEVLAPRKQLDLGGERLRVRAKDCFKLKHVPHLLGAFQQQLSHGCDGLLLLRADAPYAFGPTEGIVEWRAEAAAAAAQPASGGQPVSKDVLLEAAERWQRDGGGAS